MRQYNTYSGDKYYWGISVTSYVFMYWPRFYSLFTVAPPSSIRTHFYWGIVMGKFNFRIGTKLGIAAGLGVALVGGMLVNQQVGNALIEKYAHYSSLNYIYKGIAQEVSIATQRGYRATAGIELAISTEQLNQSNAEMQSSIAEAVKQLGIVHAAVLRPQLKTIYSDARTAAEGYLAAGNELVAVQTARLEQLAKRGQATEAWTKGLDGLLASPALAALSNRREIEAQLFEASAAFNLARAASWRYAAKAESAQKDLALSNAGKAVEILNRAQKLSDAKGIGGGIEGLVAAAGAFKARTEEVIKSDDQKTKIVSERLGPGAKTIDAEVGKGMKINGDSVKVRQDEVTEAMSRAGQIGLAVGILVMLVLIGAAVFSMLNVARPIRRIGDVLLELAKGNETVEIPYATRGDEIGDAARSAQTFRDNVVEQQRLAEAVKQSAKQRDEQTRHMEVAVENFRITSDQLLSSVGENAAIMHDTAHALTGVAGDATTQAVSAAAASEETATNVQTVAAATEELAISIQEIGRRVEQATRVVREAGSTTERSASEIENLATAGQRIGDVVGLIQAIAAQTNLLALNATIEAARAGEAGRGFAVVASEVKSLAAQTAKATEEIALQVAGIQSSTKSAVDAVREVAVAMREIDEVTTAIAGAVEEQGAATREISQNVQMASQGTQTLSSNISSVNGAIGETNRSAVAVRSASDNVTTQANNLTEEVKKFFVALRSAALDRRQSEDPNFRGPERRQDRAASRGTTTKAA
jgi:methyl-accepting chemotaxis protein